MLPVTLNLDQLVFVSSIREKVPVSEEVCGLVVCRGGSCAVAPALDKLRRKRVLRLQVRDEMAFSRVPAMASGPVAGPRGSG